MMRRGYSRDHRPDCERMVIALIVNSEGFPFSYETFAPRWRAKMRTILKRRAHSAGCTVDGCCAQANANLVVM
jgi:hypothetical protein